MTTNITTARKTFGAGALVALAVLFIGVTILITFVLRGARIDLTESKLYSIAPGTQESAFCFFIEAFGFQPACRPSNRITAFTRSGSYFRISFTAP